MPLKVHHNGRLTQRGVLDRRTLPHTPRPREIRERFRLLNRISTAGLLCEYQHNRLCAVCLGEILAKRTSDIAVLLRRVNVIRQECYGLPPIVAFARRASFNGLHPMGFCLPRENA